MLTAKEIRDSFKNFFESKGRFREWGEIVVNKVR